MNFASVDQNFVFVGIIIIESCSKIKWGQVPNGNNCSCEKCTVINDMQFVKGFQISVFDIENFTKLKI